VQKGRQLAGQNRESEIRTGFSTQCRHAAYEIWNSQHKTVCEYVFLGKSSHSKNDVENTGDTTVVFVLRNFGLSTNVIALLLLAVNVVRLRVDLRRCPQSCGPRQRKDCVILQLELGAETPNAILQRVDLAPLRINSNAYEPGLETVEVGLQYHSAMRPADSPERYGRTLNKSLAVAPLDADGRTR
jgi:hypothetical protein